MTIARNATVCPTCDQPVRVGARFCDSCGQQLGWRDPSAPAARNMARRTERSHASAPQYKQCPFCKEQMRADATTCPHCHKYAGPGAVLGQLSSAIFWLIIMAIFLAICLPSMYVILTAR